MWVLDVSRCPWFNEIALLLSWSCQWQWWTICAKTWPAARGRKVLLWFQGLHVSRTSLRSLLYMLVEKGLRFKVCQSVSAHELFLLMYSTEGKYAYTLTSGRNVKFTDASEDDLPTLGQLNSPGHSYTQGTWTSGARGNQARRQMLPGCVAHVFCPATLENQRGKVNTSTNIWWVLESLFLGPSICKTCTWLNWSLDGFHSAVWRRDSTPISWTMWKEIDKLWNTFYHSNKSKKYMKYWIGLQ